MWLSELCGSSLASWDCGGGRAEVGLDLGPFPTKPLEIGLSSGSGGLMAGAAETRGAAAGMPPTAAGGENGAGVSC